MIYRVIYALKLAILLVVTAVISMLTNHPYLAFGFVLVAFIIFIGSLLIERKNPDLRRSELDEPETHSGNSE